MAKATADKIRALVNKIDKSKDRIMIERDKLRVVYDDLSELLGNLDSAEEAFDAGLHDILDATDTISQTL